MFDFLTYDDEYFDKGLAHFHTSRKTDYLSEFGTDMTYNEDYDPRFKDYDTNYSMNFASGDNSSIEINSMDGWPRYIVIKLFDKEYSKDMSGKDIDYSFLREVVMLMDYCGSKLSEISKKAGYEVAKSGNYNKLMTELKTTLKDLLEGKKINELNIDYKSIIGEKNYINLKNKCKYTALKSRCIGSQLIPPEADGIKYPTKYEEFCEVLPKIKEIYAEVGQLDKNVEQNKKSFAYNYSDLKSQIHDEKENIKIKKSNLRDKKNTLEAGIIKASILKSKNKISELKYKRAMMPKELKYHETKLKADKKIAISKIKDILEQNTNLAKSETFKSIEL